MAYRVLWHLSHHATGRNDGWSGAPDEARWVREDLTPRVITACRALGIEVVTVDGDLASHPEFLSNYAAFCAPHYEANVHQEGGSFWGRASASVTGAEDDRFGAIFWKRYSGLVGRPPDRFGWSNVNVTDYYGFRYTTAQTPGILVEHGVGAPGAPDHDWLRANVQAIADVWALALAEFIGLPTAGPKPTNPSPIGDDMFTDEDRVMLKRVYDLSNAEGPRVWTQRLQDWLSRLFKSLPVMRDGDFKGPDVTSGQPRT